MLKRLLATLLAAALALSLNVCALAEEAAGKDAEQESAVQTQYAEPPTVTGELAKLGPDEGNFLGGLTREQKLVDFDTTMQALRENYPYFETLKRMYGVNLEERYRYYRPLIADSVSDAEFYVLLDRFAREAQMVGHLGMISPFDYGWYVDIYKNIAVQGGSENERFQKLMNAYTNAKSAQAYEKLSALVMPIYDYLMATYYAAPNSDTGAAQQTYSNIETRILEPGKIAYIKVRSLDSLTYNEDKQTLFRFYNQVRSYPHVIFDFTENGGGSTQYFNDLILAPNIAEPLTASAYVLAKAGDINKAFFGLEDASPVSELPKLPRMNEDDLAALDVFYENQYYVEPLSKQKMLNGKLWLLVSENVFSSSEYAAMFSKATGFATLVGTTTGGDGIGVDPNPIVMPNSKLILRYSGFYGVTPDGSGSQECGTEPDIVSPDGEVALTTCLKAIAAYGTK